MDARKLLRELISRKSVTPDDGGCLDLVGDILSGAGFEIERLDARKVSNLWATWGDPERLLVFAGHVDVVPAGSRRGWTSDPFEPAERDGFIYGRGACDMKGSVAAMVCAAVDAVSAGKIEGKGGLGVLLTSDEEGRAVNGTNHVVKELSARGMRLRHCVVGEPTSVRHLGDTVKHGRRGTLNARLTIRGKQGHSAYPHQCDNALHRAIRFLGKLSRKNWDPQDWNGEFPPTSFQVTDLRGGLRKTNVVPGEATATIDIRFAPPNTAERLKKEIEKALRREEIDHDRYRPISKNSQHDTRFPATNSCRWLGSADPYFAGKKTQLAKALSEVIARRTDMWPKFSTAGGTSDGRFLWRISDELLEFGPLSGTMHQKDERIGVEELEETKKIYEELIYKLLI